MTDDWRPTAGWEALRKRGEILRGIREFFRERGVVEVETPLLASTTVPDVHLASLPVRLPLLDPDREHFLQTSPEYAMKRLLAAGAGAVYQLGKAFRDGEAGSRHNPEFTLLEWYRPGWDHHRLMDDVEALLGEILGTEGSDRLAYAELFRRELGIDPHTATIGELATVARDRGIEVSGEGPADVDTWLQLLLARLVEPGLGPERPFFLYDFPPSQAALSRLRDDDPPVAERFEVYLRGVELAISRAHRRRRATPPLRARPRRAPAAGPPPGRSRRTPPRRPRNRPAPLLRRRPRRRPPRHARPGQDEDRGGGGVWVGEGLREVTSYELRVTGREGCRGSCRMFGVGCALGAGKPHFQPMRWRLGL